MTDLLPAVHNKVNFSRFFLPDPLFSGRLPIGFILLLLELPKNERLLGNIAKLAEDNDLSYVGRMKLFIDRPKEGWHKTMDINFRETKVNNRQGGKKWKKLWLSIQCVDRPTAGRN